MISTDHDAMAEGMHTVIIEKAAIPDVEEIDVFEVPRGYRCQLLFTIDNGRYVYCRFLVEKIKTK